MAAKILMATSCMCKIPANLLSRNFIVNELVSDAMNGLDVLRPRRIDFQLGSKAGDVVVDRSSDWIRLDTPNFIQQFIAGYDFARASDQQTKDSDFLPRHFNRLSLPAGDISFEV